jgi:hypothetical protein
MTWRISAAPDINNVCCQNWLISIPDLVGIVPGTTKKNRHFAFFIFAREQKCINNHFGMGFCAEMVVINTFFVFEKILNQCFFS